MDEAENLWRHYLEALDEHAALCAREPYIWHQADTRLFSNFHELFTVFAERGSVRCQYALATIHWLGLCYEREEDFLSQYEENLKEATNWWIQAASRGHWWALDDLVNCGVGPEAERVRFICHQLERQRPDLVDDEHGVPIRGPNFLHELCKMAYGRDIIQL